MEERERVWGGKKKKLGRRLKLEKEREKEREREREDGIGEGRITFSCVFFLDFFDFFTPK